MQKALINLLFAVGALVIIGIPLGILITVFYDPFSEFAIKVEMFQVLIGGSFAAIAAVITDGAIYGAATHPVRTEAKRLKKNKIQEEPIIAGILVALVVELTNHLVAIKTQILKGEIWRHAEYQPMDIPEQLRRIDVIISQPVEIGMKISKFTGEAASLNSLFRITNFDDNADKVTLTNRIQVIVDLGDELSRDLLSIAGIQNIEKK